LKKNILITFGLTIFTILIVYILTRPFFLDFADKTPTLAAFIKFFILATLGDVFAYKIKNKNWGLPKNILSKAFVWGFIGIVISYIFVIYYSGVITLMDKDILPFKNNVFFTALFISILMNLTFAPTMMAFHRITDAYLNSPKQERKQAVKSIDWNTFLNITVYKVIPLFWIPAHTITFLLPSNLRVLFAAVLGIVLGVLLSIFQKQKK